MKRTSLFSLVFLGFWALASSASTIQINEAQLPSGLPLIDFENLANGEKITNQYPGVTFTTAWGDTQSAELIHGAGNVVASNMVGGVCTPSSCQPLTIAFGAPVTDLGFVMVANNGNGIFAVTNAAGISTSFTISTTGSLQNFGMFVGFEDLSGITSLTITAPMSGALSLDNLKYGAPPVPEPSALLLLTVGVTAQFRFRKK